jgi:hypothetical protein
MNPGIPEGWAVHVPLGPLCCLFFFDIRILITTLVYSNSSYEKYFTTTKPTSQTTSMHREAYKIYMVQNEPRDSGRLSSSCSTIDTRRVNLDTNPVISHEWGHNREVFTKSGTYPWSFVRPILAWVTLTT